MVIRPSARPFLTAAAATAQEDEPDASVHPAPRSQMRISTRSRARTRANCTFVRLGNAACVSIRGPELPDLVVVELLREDDAVRVSHRDARHREEPVAHLERNGDDLPVRPMHGNLGRAEGRVPHLDRHLVDALAGR